MKPPTSDEPEPVATVLQRLLANLRPAPQRLLLLPKRQDEPDAERQQGNENCCRKDGAVHAAALSSVDAETRASWATRS